MDPETFPILPVGPASPRRRWPRALSGFLVVALAVAVLVAATVPGDDASSSYRTATATERATARTNHEVGVVEPVSQAAVAFPVSGTVAGVDVAVGDRVEVGSLLATLDTASLQAAINAAQSALDDAELTLQRAVDGEDASPATSSPTGGATATFTAVVTPTATAAEGPTSDDLRTARQAVVDAQSTVSDDLAAASAALTEAQATCAALPAGSADQVALDACRDALAVVLAAQQQAQSSQAALVEAADRLDDLLAQREAATQATTPRAAEPSTTTTTTAPATSRPASSPAAAGATSTGTASSPSSEDLIAYQAAVDAAELDVAVAHQALRQASVHSPIAGVVASVAVAPGDAVDAATTAITVVGDGGYQVTATVTVDEVTDYEIGQAVEIDPDGTGASLQGEVVAIGSDASSDGASTTYRVVVGIDGAGSELRNGSVAALTITTEAASAAVTVPTSAVQVDGGRHSVTVLDRSGATSEVRVTVGAVGATYTEVVSGLEAGQVVVVADPDQPLPGSATDTSSSATQSGPFPGRGDVRAP